MDDAQFWGLIGSIDTHALDEGDEERAIEPLYQALRGKTEAELASFGECLSRQLFAIDGRTYADNAGIAGGSDDGFLYARCYVVAKGRGFYEAVKANPKKMPKSLDLWCESLLYQHRVTWSELVGRDQSEWPFRTSVSYETGSNRDLWDVG
jgi:hypothetical protein